MYWQHGSDPSLDEFSMAISVMKNCRAPISNGIPAEILKYRRRACWRDCLDYFLIYGVLKMYFKTSDTTTVTIYKRNGEKSTVASIMGSCYSLPLERFWLEFSFEHLLHNMVNHVLPESQCSFRPMQGMAGMVFVAQQMQEKCREQELYSLYWPGYKLLTPAVDPGFGNYYLSLVVQKYSPTLWRYFMMECSDESA